MHGHAVIGEVASDPPAPIPATGHPRQCWEIVRQIPGLTFNCEECYAYFVRQSCWTLWALRQPGAKPCCQKKDDCAECAVLRERTKPLAIELLTIERLPPARPPLSSSIRMCTYLQVFSGNEAVEGDSKNAAVFAAMRGRNADLRCRLRGVHLDLGYANDICVSRQVDDCVFLDQARPEVRIASAVTCELPDKVEGKHPVEKAAGKQLEVGGPDSPPRAGAADANVLGFRPSAE